MKKILLLLTAFALAGCENFLGSSEKSSDFVNDGVAPAVQATHGGWTQIKATGPKSPAGQSADLATAAAAVTLSWNNATAASGTIASYHLYRSNTSGGARTLVAAGIATGARTYTDSTVSANTTYYYKAVPVLSSGEVTEVTGADSEIKIMVPPANMALLHRWAANLDFCTEMGKTPIRSENYRCVVATGGTAPPGTGGSGYMDLGSSIFVDMFEQGCNYTYSSTSNQCGSANGCIGTLANPHGTVNGNDGDIYYSRQTGSCFLNFSGGVGSNWTNAFGATAIQRRTMGSAAAGLPPFVDVSQEQAQDICTGQTVAGIAGTKRLLRRKEQVAVAKWASTLNDATIDTIENGMSLNTTGHCNSNFADPQGNSTVVSAMGYDNNQVPAAMDTLPGCRNNDCAAASAGGYVRSLRTGSNATSVCVSAFGVQDMVGNVWELASDQAACNGATCAGIAAAANTADNTNDDLNGVAFDDTQAPTSFNTFTTWGRVQFPVGLPIAGPGFAGDGTVARTAAQFHSDHFRVNVAASNRASRSGGSWWDGAGAGRFTLNFNYDPASSGSDIGFRCAITAD